MNHLNMCLSKVFIKMCFGNRKPATDQESYAVFPLHLNTVTHRLLKMVIHEVKKHEVLLRL